MPRWQVTRGEGRQSPRRGESCEPADPGREAAGAPWGIVDGWLVTIETQPQDQTVRRWGETGSQTWAILSALFLCAEVGAAFLGQVVPALLVAALQFPLFALPLLGLGRRRAERGDGVLMASRGGVTSITVPPGRKGGFLCRKGIGLGSGQPVPWRRLVVLDVRPVGEGVTRVEFAFRKKPLRLLSGLGLLGLGATAQVWSAAVFLLAPGSRVAGFAAMIGAAAYGALLVAVAGMWRACMRADAPQARRPGSRRDIHDRSFLEIDSAQLTLDGAKRFLRTHAGDAWTGEATRG